MDKAAFFLGAPFGIMGYLPTLAADEEFISLFKYAVTTTSYTQP